jgi:hypothetical protein
MERYVHSQTGTLMIAQGSASLALNAMAIKRKGGTFGRWLALALSVATLAVFSRLKVVVDDESVEVSFWPRQIGRRLPLSTIASCAVVRNPWYWGWGIRIIPGGWLFNVQGRRAVELTLVGGGRVRIGSDEPEALEAAVTAALAERDAAPAAA